MTIYRWCELRRSPDARGLGGWPPLPLRPGEGGDREVRPRGGERGLPLAGIRDGP